ncbi:hypothetical protein QBC44DRAFT_316313 [Cladorrhinum sp. PSN332]|nr:hypothetical protein QBC44DRAFT_316313 [Cladorrhinum sp. PSN332]
MQGGCLLNCAICAGYVGYVRFVGLFRYVLNVGRIRFVDLIAAVGFVLCFDFSASTWTGLFDPRYESSHFCGWGCAEMVTVNLGTSALAECRVRAD